MAAIVIADLTVATLDGAGVFDVLMRATKVHLEAEFAKNRIKGSEYATVYLGSLNSVMTASLAFLLQKDKADQEAHLIIQQILLATQQTANAVLEGTVLVAQKLKLDAEIILINSTKDKTVEETALLLQKTVTEKAQILAAGVDVNSVVGKQKALYSAQTDGFTRDAEQKAVKLMVDTWNVRRTTDENTTANATNKLQDSAVGAAVTKLLEGIGVSV